MKHILILALAMSASIATAQTVIPNAGFENWTAVGTYSLPDNWSTLNNTTATYSIATATKGTPGSPGTGYLKLTSKTTGAMVTGGIAVSGKLDTLTMQPKSGFAYNARPANFAGKWQYMIYGNSVGSIHVLTTKWNATDMKRDTIAHAEHSLAGMAMSWANFSIPLSYLDSLRYPDSCIIVLKASGNNPTNNDYLWVDNLSFSGTVAIVSPTVSTVGIAQHSASSLNILQILPNPAHNAITLNISSKEAAQGSLTILSVNGAVIEHHDLSLQVGNNKQSLSISHLSSGIYFVQVNTKDFTTLQRLIIE